MKLADALIRIRQGRDRMHALYQQPVFDEWAVIVSANGTPSLSSYEGPRAEAFRREFIADIGPLMGELTGQHLDVGGFAFAAVAKGTRFDACVRLGAQAYLFCNHTRRSMAEIRADPRWLSAQKAFVELTEAFRADPLE